MRRGGGEEGAEEMGRSWGVELIVRVERGIYVDGREVGGLVGSGGESGR